MNNYNRRHSIAQSALVGTAQAHSENILLPNQEKKDRQKKTTVRIGMVANGLRSQDDLTDGKQLKEQAIAFTLPAPSVAELCLTPLVLKT